MEEKTFDVIVIGGGPGGLSAALYTTRALLSTLILERSVVGGLITTTTEIENYPGSDTDATGTSLTQRMLNQALDAGAEIDFDSVEEIKKINDNVFKLKGMSGTCLLYTSMLYIMTMIWLDWKKQSINFMRCC